MVGQGLDEEEIHTINNIRLICSGISILSCLVIMVFYFLMCFSLRCKKKNFDSQGSMLSEINNTEENDNFNQSGQNQLLITNESFSDDSFKKRKKMSLPESKVKKQVGNKMGMVRDLIFFLIISNLGYSIGSFLGINGFKSSDKNNPLCIAQAFTQNFFDISSICWNSIISRVSLLGTRRNCSEMNKVQNKLWVYVIYSNLMPLIICLGPFFTESYGPSGIWCWIDMDEFSQVSVIWICFIYCFTWLHIFYVIYALLTTSIYFTTRKNEIENDLSKAHEVRLLKKYVLFLRIFPLTLVLTRLTSTLNRGYTMLYNEDNAILYGLQATFYSLSGFFNALFYSYYYRSVFLTCCPKKEEEVQV
jgi:hypothetical protein